MIILLVFVVLAILPFPGSRVSPRVELSPPVPAIDRGYFNINGSADSLLDPSRNLTAILPYNQIYTGTQWIKFQYSDMGNFSRESVIWLVPRFRGIELNISVATDDMTLNRTVAENNTPVTFHGNGTVSGEFIIYFEINATDPYDRSLAVDFIVVNMTRAWWWTVDVERGVVTGGNDLSVKIADGKCLMVTGTDVLFSVNGSGVFSELIVTTGAGGNVTATMGIMDDRGYTRREILLPGGTREYGFISKVFFQYSGSAVGTISIDRIRITPISVSLDAEEVYDASEHVKVRILTNASESINFTVVVGTTVPVKITWAYQGVIDFGYLPPGTYHVNVLYNDRVLTYAEFTVEGVVPGTEENWLPVILAGIYVVVGAIGVGIWAYKKFAK